ncbi:hypothetical protein AOQ84DRAFT_16963 [Glonium stellatum]|uniref:DUF7932 domain-containing protein n=1 Tax=Glonium stellatum TaxID=574774 RepID=A0A8E2F3U4_9PEZI|nr:hypothetical protein AOQ84DRAFT_16963 [Glonium stellatum]
MPGSDVRVRLSYNSTRQNCIQVGGEGGFTGAKWEVNRDQNLMLNVKGGDGGNGGRGENGQQGGQGAPGRDATKYHDATAGGIGAPGGNGGYGTNGANGADAGNVFITVHESDLDTLACVFWDLNGGSGGLSGTHGQPGEGGIGGRGGNGGRWEDRVGDRVSTVTRGPGAPGPQGPPGIPPATFLSGGQSGKQGSSQIRVIKGDLTEATFPKRSGEHIIVRNLIVENVGGMPSPNLNRLMVSIHGDRWFEPVTSVELPREIQVGDKVKVPGEIRALIRNETAARIPGHHLFENTEVRLIATFDERLQRSLPEFHVGEGAPIEIQYPLQLTPPRYLDCVAKGDNVRFSWTLKNVSTKEYGIQGNLRRHVATRLSDPDGVFNLKYGAGRRWADDELDILLPGAEVPIDQDFTVSSNAMEYSDSVLTLDLMLSDPSKPQAGTGSASSVRSVMRYDMKMQISGKYEYKEKSRFLLVVNAGTPNYAIHQIINFIRKGLQLEVDIFNISLTGSFIDPITNTDVLSRYVGKSIIIYGSTLSYFRLGHRSPWDLLDPWEVCRLAKLGTSFLFANVADSNGLQSWSSLSSFPTPATAAPSSVNVENLAGLLDSLKPGKQAADALHSYHKFGAKKNPLTGCFGDLDSALLSHSKKAAKKLNKTYPLRRFVARPDVTDGGKGNSGAVIVSEGLPKSAKVFASRLPHQPGPWILDYHMYMVVACLPFSDQARIFWNLAGQWDKNGLPPTALYNGLPHLINSKPGDQMNAMVATNELINEKVFQAICISIESQIGTEITRYCDVPSWPNPIPTNEVMNHLPLLSQLLHTTPSSAPIGSTERTEFLVGVLGTIMGALEHIGFVQWWSNVVFRIGVRKVQVRAQVKMTMNTALSHKFTPAAISTLQKSIEKTAKQTKKEIKQTKQESKNLSLVNLSRLSAFTGTTDAAPDDLTMPTDPAVANSTGWTRNKLQENRKLHTIRQEKRLADEAHSRRVIAEHVNPEDEDDGEEEDNGPDEYEEPNLEDMVRPTGPTGPAGPHGMAAPVELFSPVDTTAPVELASPDALAPPVELASPNPPAAPVELASPDAPAAPVEPAAPQTPTAPVELASPHIHAAPVELASPQIMVSSEKNIPQTHVVAVREVQ